MRHFTFNKSDSAFTDNISAIWGLTLGTRTQEPICKITLGIRNSDGKCHAQDTSFLRLLPDGKTIGYGCVHQGTCLGEERAPLTDLDWIQVRFK